MDPVAAGLISATLVALVGGFFSFARTRWGKPRPPRATPWNEQADGFLGRVLDELKKCEERSDEQQREIDALKAEVANLKLQVTWDGITDRRHPS